MAEGRMDSVNRQLKPGWTGHGTARLQVGSGTQASYTTIDVFQYIHIAAKSRSNNFTKLHAMGFKQPHGISIGSHVVIPSATESAHVRAVVVGVYYLRNDQQLGGTKATKLNLSDRLRLFVIDHDTAKPFPRCVAAGEVCAPNGEVDASEEVREFTDKLWCDGSDTWKELKTAVTGIPSTSRKAGSPRVPTPKGTKRKSVMPERFGQSKQSGEPEDPAHPPPQKPRKRKRRDTTQVGASPGLTPVGGTAMELDQEEVLPMSRLPRPLSIHSLRAHAGGQRGDGSISTCITGIGQIGNVSDGPIMTHLSNLAMRGFEQFNSSLVTLAAIGGRPQSASGTAPYAPTPMAPEESD
eukprot:m.197426 g.197426  ORF g.197426 m.197426 type:complete len:352 (-) comp15277_c0_seq4:409-1464(-)